METHAISIPDFDDHNQMVDFKKIIGLSYDDNTDAYHLLMQSKERNASRYGLVTVAADNFALLRVRVFETWQIDTQLPLELATYNHQRDEFASKFEDRGQDRRGVIVSKVETPTVVFRYAAPRDGPYAIRQIQAVLFDNRNDRLILLDCLSMRVISIDRHNGSPCFLLDFDGGFDVIESIQIHPVQRKLLVYLTQSIIHFDIDTGQRLNTFSIYDLLMNDTNDRKSDGVKTSEYAIQQRTAKRAYFGSDFSLFPHSGWIVNFDPVSKRLMALCDQKQPRFFPLCSSWMVFLAYDTRRLILTSMDFFVNDEDIAVKTLPIEHILPEAFVWEPRLHARAPRAMRNVVETVTKIRSLVFDSPLMALPNELLFSVFFYL